MGNDPLQDYIRSHGVPLATKDIQPPAFLFIEQGTLLTSFVFNSNANVDLEMDAIVLLPDGEYKLLKATSTPASNRTSDSNLSIKMPRCYLLALTVWALSGSPSRGETYCQVELDSTIENGVLMGSLASGYITSGHRLTWPQGEQEPGFSGRGHIKAVTGTDPAAGAEISETVPTNAIWRLIAFDALLTSDATVANRTPAIQITDGTNQLYQCAASAAQTASDAKFLHAATRSILAQDGFTDFHVPLPNELILKGGFEILTNTGSLQSGDDWGAPQMLVEEWIDK